MDLTQFEQPKWASAPFLKDQIDIAKQFVAAQAAERLAKEIGQAMSLGPFSKSMESPLEAAFYAWWLAFQSSVFMHDHDYRLETQHWVELEGQRFRLDFAILPTKQFASELADLGLSMQPVAVELDGHAFHEKTKEQATKRNQRDRLLQQAGWKVFHISYDEMVSGGGQPVYDVACYVSGQACDLSCDAHYRSKDREEAARGANQNG